MSPERLRHLLVVTLTFGTGAVDAIVFLHLGGAFASVMTGNMVLFGLSIAQGDGARALLVGTAIAAYVLGVVCGTVLAGRSRSSETVWPRQVTRVLAVEGGALLVLAVCWWVLLPTDRPTPEEVMLAFAALALGMQGSAVQCFGIPGLSSTYLTGTLTTIISGFAARRPVGDQLPGIMILLALIVGAATGDVILDVAWRAAPLAFICPLGAVIAAACVIRWEERGIAERGHAGRRARWQLRVPPR